MRCGGRPTRLGFPSQDLARIGRELAVHHVEAGGLAGAVRADERDQLARRDAEGNVAHRLDAAVRLGQIGLP